MNWYQHIDFDHCEASTGTEASRGAMTPGLTDTYDSALREKAGLHSPPPPPECMGLEGEYDDCGLVRRVAQALDQDRQAAAVDTVSLIQRGGTVVLTGRVGDRALLDRIVAVIGAVDGTRAIDSAGVVVEAGAG